VERSEGIRLSGRNSARRGQTRERDCMKRVDMVQRAHGGFPRTRLGRGITSIRTRRPTLQRGQWTRSASVSETVRSRASDAVVSTAEGGCERGLGS
jgi:hypothetical protein